MPQKDRTSRPSNPRCHIAIIGAGPAGCAAAITLRRAGHDVTLIEKKSFPRVKVCGEFISPAATEVLQMLLDSQELRRAGAARVCDFTLELDSREARYRMPSPAWVLSRRALDALLLAKAEDIGANVMQPASVRRVEYDHDRVLIHFADAARDALPADLIIHADGTGRHDPAGATPNRAGVIGQKCHLTMPAGAEIRGLRMRCAYGAYIGTVGVERGEATCALVARTNLITRFNGDADAMLTKLWPGYQSTWRASKWFSCGVAGSSYIRPGHVRSVRIGNAAAAVEPVGGEGIGLALWSGATLAEHLSTHERLDPAALNQVQRTFARAYRKRLRYRRPACRLAAEVLMRPSIAQTIWPLLKAPNLTIRPWYALSGKPV